MYTALKQRVENYINDRKICNQAFSEEAVHDLRVSARRLLALIELLREIAPNFHLQKLRRALKDQLENLNELRDTQVILIEIEATREMLPELDRLQRFLQKREARLLQNAERNVLKFKTSSITRCLEEGAEQLATLGDNSELNAALLNVVDDAWVRVQRRKKHVDPAHPASIHRVRIAFKKFRYMIEIIHPILEGFPDANFKKMHKHQAVMGDFQDVEVLLKHLAIYSARHARQNLQSVRMFYEQRHAERINACIQTMNESAPFWREAPNQPFPWEPSQKVLP